MSTYLSALLAALDSSCARGVVVSMGGVAIRRGRRRISTPRGRRSVDALFTATVLSQSGRQADPWRKKEGGWCGGS